MPAATVRRISKIQGLGVIKDCPPPPVVPLRRYNLIYGFNATGKTTLSRLFACLQLGARHPKLPANSSFEVELSDGSHLKSSGDLSALSKRVLVFNEDFKEENLRWKEGTASPVFYIGREQSELVTALEEASSKLEEVESDLRVAEQSRRGAENAFATFKRDAARLIAEQLGLGRKYTATHLDSDYTNFDQKPPLSEEDLERSKQILGQHSPLPPLQDCSLGALRIEVLLREADDRFRTTIGRVTQEDIVGHDSMFGWISQGIQYHHQHELKSCLFCANPLASDRLQSLAAAIDSRFEQMIGEVSQTQRRCDDLSQHSKLIVGSLPSVNDVTPEARPQFSESASEIEKVLGQVPPLLDRLRAALEEKRAKPATPLSLADFGLSLDEAVALDQALAALMLRLNESISLHNKAFRGFEQAQQEASRRLKSHYLMTAHDEYAAMAAKVAQEVENWNALEEARTELKARMGELNRKIRVHGPAATVMTAMIQNYLGRSDFQIAAVESGYQLIRSGEVVRGSLSEGEKTAIALCYFLSTIESEGRVRGDLIVVVDDPVSSLDTRALNYAFSIIRSALGESGQLVLLTHNVNFMNEAKKWLKRKTKPAEDGKDPLAALLYLDVARSTDGSRRTVLVDLPKYIRDFESEYHYLFHFILQFASASTEERGSFFVVPNALRKVLEIFLAFKRPGPEGISSKLHAIAQQDLGLDPARVMALDRLVQVESHADSLDDLVAFSSMTVEETVDATNGVLDLMRALDREHFERLSRQCA